jgi:hypothetical protein
MNAQAFPNPTKDILNIETRLVKRVPIDISLTDVVGKIIFQESFENYTGKYQKALNIGNLPTGVYILTAKLGDNVWTEKIIKE